MVVAETARPTGWIKPVAGSTGVTPPFWPAKTVSPGTRAQALLVRLSRRVKGTAAPAETASSVNPSTRPNWAGSLDEVGCSVPSAATLTRIAAARSTPAVPVGSAAVVRTASELPVAPVVVVG